MKFKFHQWNSMAPSVRKSTLPLYSGRCRLGRIGEAGQPC